MIAEIRIGCMVNPIMSDALRQRASDVSNRVNSLNAERGALADRIGGIPDVPPRHFRDNIPLDGQASWVTAGTFTDPDAALAEVARMQRARIELPVRGLLCIREIQAVRDAVQDAWQAHKGKLEKALTDAVKRATKEASKLPVSAALQQAHIEELTATERQAAAMKNPCPPDWWGWASGSLKNAEAILLQELREAMHTAVS